MIRFAAPLVVFALLVLVFIKGLDPNRDLNELPSPFLGKPAPQFELPQLLDPTASLSNETYAGELALINIWATWYVGCRQEHAFLNDLAAENVLPIYGINWRDRRDEALKWVEQLGNPYVASGYDGDGRVGIDWGVYGAPETFLISKDGRVLHKHLGPLSRNSWETDFLPLIAAETGDTK
jgi:cytochrome c biogenesis protein CcmG/thiol:disulfide interchange protein DsbE